jgi:hypothetical protein
MSAVASWADKMRYTKAFAWTEPLHFVDIRDDWISGGCPSMSGDGEGDGGDDKCIFDYTRDCGNGLCAVHSIEQMANQLLNATLQHDDGHGNEMHAHDYDDYDYEYEYEYEYGPYYFILQQQRYRALLSNNKNNHLLRGVKPKSSPSTTNTVDDPLLHSSTPSSIPFANFTTRQSLMFLIHFVGDIHQPLHVSRKTDIGGNTIHVSFLDEINGSNDINDSNDSNDGNDGNDKNQFHHRFIHKNDFKGVHEYSPIQLLPNNELHAHNGWNLHSVWDTGMIEYTIKNDFNQSQSDYQTYIENTYMTTKHTQQWNNDCIFTSKTFDKDCVTIWADESWHDALRYAYANEYGDEIVNDDVITMEYVKSRLPVVERRLAAGGVRLASVLEMIYSS